jgi:hypothetical protein
MDCCRRNRRCRQHRDNGGHNSRLTDQPDDAAGLFAEPGKDTTTPVGLDQPVQLAGSPPNEAATVTAIVRPAQWMTLSELRDELERTCQAWRTTDLDYVLAHGQLPVLSKDAHRHQLVADELLRRTSDR